MKILFTRNIEILDFLSRRKRRSMMNHSPDDPDELVRNNIDHNHITNISQQMHVPDSITVGPNRATGLRLHQDHERLPVRMEVPDTIRIGNDDHFGAVNGMNFERNHSSESATLQTSLPLSDIEAPSDEEYSTVDPPRNNRPYQPIKIADSWHIEPFHEVDDKNVLNKFQLLQNRIHHIERSLVRRDFRDRIVYTCIIGYFLLQTFLSVRRSMSN